MFNFYCRSVQAVMRVGAKLMKFKEPILVKGADSSLALAKLARENNVSKVLIVTDKGIASLGLMDNMLKAFDEANFPYAIFDETVPNPTLQNVEDALLVYKKEQCQGIIAYGGGSAMDCAKVLAARIVKPNTPIVKMKGYFRVLKKIVPLFAIPTTAGTGSETTIAAVISNPETHEKYAIGDPCLVPDYAILDPNLTLKLPKHITSTTGMDALTHAIEAFIGQSGTAYTDDCAKKCVKLVFENLYKAYENGEDLEARENMQMAAFYGGIAFTRAYVGYVHAIAHTLGGFYKTPHGLANAFILPHVLAYYGEAVYKKLAELADLVQIVDASDSDEAKAKKFIEAIRELNKSMEIPEYTDVIQDKDIPTMVERAFNEANPMYPVPKILSKDEIKELYLIISQKGKLNYGYAGKLAEIDLTSSEIKNIYLDDEILEKYVGGKTLAAKIIYDRLININNFSKVEPLSEENILVVTTGPLTGTGSPCSSRFNISSISPLTGILVSSNCGGTFGMQLKKAGFDGLIIKGKSKEKVYINITDDKIEILSAKDIWGKNTVEVQEILKGKNNGILTIGTAGENLVKYANLISGERAAGRGGLGAIFGYKNLKALVAKGSKNFVMYDSTKLKIHNKKWIKILQNHPITGDSLPKYGTANLVRKMQKRNLLATRNFSRGDFDNFEDLSGETLAEKYLVKNKGCVTCPIQCGRQVTAFGKTVKGPELETIGLLGSNLENSDMQNIINLNYLADDYGIDTMTFGSTIALAMELNELNIWKNELEFGKNDNLEDLVRKVSLREGIGDELAEGSRLLAQKHGGEEYAIHSKGMELAAYEPRSAQAMGLGYATSNRGGCHLNGGYGVILEGLGFDINRGTTRGKVAFTIFFQDLMEAVSSAGSCLFTTYAALPGYFVKNSDKALVKLVFKCMPYYGGMIAFMSKHKKLMCINLASMMPYPVSLRLVTGKKYTIGSFIELGERGYDLERAINVKLGISEKDDTLPKRLIKDLQRGNDPQSRVRLEEMKEDYYKIRGWRKKGLV